MSADRDLHEANRAVITALRTPSIEPPRRKWPSRGAIIVIATIFGAFCLSLLWPWVRPPAPEAIPAPEVVVQREDESKYTAAPDLVSATASSKPGNSFVLVATQLLSDPKSATALIGTSPDAPQTYRLGAILPNGARIAEIHRDRVLLTRGDNAATLRVTVDVGQAAAAPQVSGDAALVALAEVPVVQMPVNPLSTDDAGALAVTSPEYRDGSVVGVRLYAGSNSSLFYAIGLQNGDFLPNVDAESVNATLRAALSGGAVSIRVRREGTTKEVILKRPVSDDAAS